MMPTKFLGGEQVILIDEKHTGQPFGSLWQVVGVQGDQVTVVGPNGSGITAPSRNFRRVVAPSTEQGPTPVREGQADLIVFNIDKQILGPAVVRLYESGIVHIDSEYEDLTVHISNIEIIWRLDDGHPSGPPRLHPKKPYLKLAPKPGA